MTTWGVPRGAPAVKSTNWPYTALGATNYLDRFVENEYLARVTISVEEAFNAGVTATVGFPGAVDEIALAADIDLQTVGKYTFNPYKVFATVQTLNLYIGGTATAGRLITLVEASE